MAENPIPACSRPTSTSHHGFCIDMCIVQYYHRPVTSHLMTVGRFSQTVDPFTSPLLSLLPFSPVPSLLPSPPCSPRPSPLLYSTPHPFPPFSRQLLLPLALFSSPPSPLLRSRASSLPFYSLPPFPSLLP